MTAINNVITDTMFSLVACYIVSLEMCVKMCAIYKTIVLITLCYGDSFYHSLFFIPRSLLKKVSISSWLLLMTHHTKCVTAVNNVIMFSRVA